MPARGEGGTSKRPPRGKPPRPTRADKQATIWAAEQNLKPWEAQPHFPKPSAKQPRIPAAKAPRDKPGASQEQRYRWAVQAPVSPKARQKLANTMSADRRRQREQSLRPPPPPSRDGHRKGFLGAVEALPGSILGTYAGIGRAAERGAAALGTAAGTALLRPAIETAYGLQAPQRGPAGVIPKPVAAAAAGARLGVEALGGVTVGPHITEAITNPALGKPIIPASHRGQAAIALDAAFLLPGGRLLKGGAAALAAAKVAEESAHLPAAARRKLVEAAFDRVLEGPNLVSGSVQAARKSSVIRGESRNQAHALIDTLLENEPVAAKVAKERLDAQVYQATRAVPIRSRREAAAQAYHALMDDLRGTKVPWSKNIHADASRIKPGTRVRVDVDHDLLGPHQTEGRLDGVDKTKIRFTDDEGQKAIPHGKVIAVHPVDEPSPHGIPLPTREEARVGIGSPVPAEGAAHEIADRVLASGVHLPERLRDPAELAAAIQKVMQLARDGAEYGDWYRRAAASLEDVYQRYKDTGVSRNQIAQLAAIFSTGSDPTTNMKFVLDALDSFRANKPITAGRFGSQAKEAKQVFSKQGWSGRKRNSFYANMLRNLDPKAYEELQKSLGREGHPITADMWVVRMFAPWQKKDVPEKSYDAFEQMLTEIGQHLGMEPEEAQAAAWVAAKTEGVWTADIRRAAARGTVSKTTRARALERGSDAYEIPLRKYGVREAEPGDAGALRRGRGDRRPQREGGGAVGGGNVPERGVGHPVPRFTEIEPTDAGARQYIEAVKRNPRTWSVTPPDPERLKQSRLFLSENGDAGYALGPDGEIFGVFRNAGPGGVAYQAALQGAHRGGSWLNVYDIPAVHSRYQAAGFVEVARIPFNREFAPTNFPPEMGEPDIVFMAFGARPHPVRQFTDWDAAASYARELSNPVKPTGSLVRPGFEIEPTLGKKVAAYRERVSYPLRAPPATPQFKAESLTDVAGDIDRALSEHPEIPPAEAERMQGVSAQLKKLGAMLADESGEVHPDAFFPNFEYMARTRTYHDLVQQVPQARAHYLPELNITKAGERVTDWALVQLEKSKFFRRKGLQQMTVGGSVMKYAGREQRDELAKRIASAHNSIHAITKIDEGSPEDIANFWYAQLPDEYKNAEGLRLVQAKQKEYLERLTSGDERRRIERKVISLRAQARQLEASAKEADKAGDLPEAAALRARARRLSQNEVQRWQMIQADLPIQIQDTYASIKHLDTLIADPPAVNEAAIQAVHALSTERRNILIAGGRLDADIAEGRMGKVSQWVGLEPTGEEAYIGHRLPREANYPGPPTNQIPAGVGTVRSPAGVGSENRLLLASQGRLRASLRVAVEDWNGAQQFEIANMARDTLGKAGPTLRERMASRGDMNVDYRTEVLINRKGHTVPRAWRSEDYLRFHDNWDDVEEVRAVAHKITEGYLAEDDAAAQRFIDEAQSLDDLVVVPKRLVERYYAQFRTTGRTTTGKVADTAADWLASAIVTIRIGYIPKNIVQNLILWIPHQGPLLLTNAVRAAQLMADPEIRPLLRQATGHGGATALIGRTASRTGRIRGVTAGERLKGANIVGSENVEHVGPGRIARAGQALTTGREHIHEWSGAIGDDYFRITALVHEMARERVISPFKPFITDEDRAAVLKALTAPRGSKAEQQMSDISYRAKQAMADFDRLTPTQNRWARRVLIVPSWLMAGTRYPFRFAADHPLRTAMIAYIALGEPKAPEELQFNHPAWQYLHGERWLQGLNTPWGRWRTNSLSPISTPLEIGMAVAGIGDQTAWDYTSPFLALMYSIASSRIEYPGGSYKAPRTEVAKKVLKRQFPLVTFAKDIISPPSDPYYPGDVHRWQRFLREIGVAPIPVPDQLRPGRSSGSSGVGGSVGGSTGGSVGGGVG